MDASIVDPTVIALTFALAVFVKGVIGVGLPTVRHGLGAHLALRALA